MYTTLEVVARTTKCTTMFLVQRKTDLLLCTVHYCSPISNARKHSCQGSSIFFSLSMTITHPPYMTGNMAAAANVYTVVKKETRFPHSTSLQAYFRL